MGLMSAAASRWLSRTAQAALLCLLAAPCAVGRSGEPTRAPPSLLAPSAVPMASDLDQASAAISTRRDRIGRLIASVTINGQGPYHFMIDTGANRTVLAESLLPQLGIGLDRQHRVVVLGISGEVQAATAHIDSLDTGALHFRDVQLPVLSGLVLDGIDGILGMDGFAGMAMAADFVHDTFTISDSKRQRAPPNYSVVPVRFLSQRLLMIDAWVGHVRTKAIIDTGSTHTLGNPALLAALERSSERNGAERDSSIVDATEASQAGRDGRVPAVRLGTATISNLYVTFGDFHVFDTWGLSRGPALLIGMDVLGTLAGLTIDFRNHELDLLPRGSTATIPLARMLAAR
jgi:predicted aspartyl protease